MEVIDEFDGIEFDRELYDVPPPEAYGLPRTPFVEYRKPSVVEKGTFYKPILREITRGQIDNSRIYHTREGNEHNFEYRRYNVYKKGFTAQCIYSRRPDVKCPATKDLTALNPVAIYRTQVPGKRAKFEINRNIPLSTADWSVTENISRKSHTEFCKRQVEYKDRVHNLDILNGNDRFAIIKERAKYPRFQENGPLTREFRFVHTRKAIPSQKYETKTQEREWTFRPNHGPRFYPMIMRMTNELRSSYYHQQKGKDKSAPGEIHEAITHLFDTDRATKRAIKLKLIHLNDAANFIPIYLASELYLLSQPLFADGSFSVVRNKLGNHGKFCQIYIFSVNYQMNQRTFNYPLAMFLMKKKSKQAYVEVLKFLCERKYGHQQL